MTTQWTYAGLFDDRVYAYDGDPLKAESPEDDKARLNEFLTHAFYFDRPLAINDGYLFQTPYLRGGCTPAGARTGIQDDRSLFRRLAKYGYVNVLTRQPGKPLKDLAPWAKEKDIGSLGRVPTEMRGSAWDVFAKHLDDFDASVTGPQQVAGSPPGDVDSVTIGKRRWPKRDTAEAFKLLLLDAIDNGRVPSDLTNEAQVQFDTLVQQLRSYVKDPTPFANSEGKVPPPRTFWERQIKSIYRHEVRDPVQFDLTAARHPLARRMMHFGNCIYHLSHAACFAAEGTHCEISTLADLSLGEYFVNPDYAPIESFLASDTSIAIEVPANLDALEDVALDELMRNEDFHSKKRAYLRCVESWQSGPGSIQEVLDAKREYQRVIDSLRWKRLFDRSINVYELLSSTSLTTMLKACAGTSRVGYAGIQLADARDAAHQFLAGLLVIGVVPCFKKWFGVTKVRSATPHALATVPDGPAFHAFVEHIRKSLPEIYTTDSQRDRR